MDYFKILPNDILIHSQLMAMKPVSDLWKKYKEAKPLALRIILYAMNMADYTLSNPYGDMSHSTRKQRMIVDYFQGNPKYTELSETKILVQHFREMYNNMPGHQNLKALSTGNHNLRIAVESYKGKEAGTEDVLNYSKLLTGFNKNTEEYLKTQLNMYAYLRAEFEKYESEHDLEQPYV